MNKKIGASGLLLVAVGGLTASGAVSAMGEDLPGVVKNLSYNDQEKIYKDLTTSSWDLAGVFTGKDLTSTSNEKIYKQLGELRKKDESKFDKYMENNYALNSLVNDWDEKGVKELLDKLNKKGEEGKESSNIYTKKYLIQNPYEALDFAYNNNSSLVDNVDKSAVIKKIKDNKEYLGIDAAITPNMSFTQIGALASDSAKNEYSRLLANSVGGENAGVSKALKAKHYLRKTVECGLAAGFIAGAFSLIKSAFNKITGRKTEKIEDASEVTPEDAQEIQDESVYIFTPYDEEEENSESQPKDGTPVVKTPDTQKSKIPAAANNVKKPKAVLSRNKKAQKVAIGPAKSKASVAASVNDVKMSSTTSKSVHKQTANDPAKSKTSVTAAVNGVKTSLTNKNAQKETTANPVKSETSVTSAVDDVKNQE